MAVLAAVVTALAVWWWTAPQGALERLGHVPRPARIRPARGPNLAPVVVLLTCALAGGLLGGGQGGALGVAVGILGATAAVLLQRRRARLEREHHRREVVRAAETMTGLLRAGRIPTLALAEAAEEVDLLEPAARDITTGGDVAEALRRRAAEPGQEGLAHLADAWQVAAAVGSPQVGAWEQASASLIAEDEVARQVTTEVAAARASGQVMAGLPLIGLVLALGMGGDPLGFLLGSPFGWICLAAAALLLGVGVLWIDLIAEGDRR